MLDSCTYDKIRLLYELSKLTWYIQKHAKPNAQAADQMETFDALELLALDLEKHINQLENQVCK